MTVVVGHFEGNLAVIEYKIRAFPLPRALLPKHAEEGNVFNLIIEVDRDAKKRYAKIGPSEPPPLAVPPARHNMVEVTAHEDR